MARALVVGNVPLWPGAAGGKSLAGYLRHLDYFVDEVTDLSDAKHNLACGEYAFAVMSLFISYPNDSYLLLDWMFRRTDCPSVIIMDESAFTAENRRKLKAYRNLAGVLTPEDCKEDMNHLLQILDEVEEREEEDQSKRGHGGGTKDGDGKHEDEEKEEIKQPPPWPVDLLRWLLCGAGLMGLVWLRILMLNQEPGESHTVTEVLLLLISLACLFAVFGKNAEKAMDALKKLREGFGFLDKTGP